MDSTSEGNWGWVPLMGVGHRSTDNERGAAVVEFALLSVLLFMLIFAGITTGIAVSQSNALQTAAREGARFGATLPNADLSANLDQIIGVVRAAATGDLDASVPGQYICVAFTDGSTISVRAETGGALSTPLSDCFTTAGITDNRPSGEERIQVVVGRDASIEAVAFDVDVALSSEAVARYER